MYNAARGPQQGRGPEAAYATSRTRIRAISRASADCRNARAAASCSAYAASPSVALREIAPGLAGTSGPAPDAQRKTRPSIAETARHPTFARRKLLGRCSRSPPVAQFPGSRERGLVRHRVGAEERSRRGSALARRCVSSWSDELEEMRRSAADSSRSRLLAPDGVLATALFQEVAAPRQGRAACGAFAVARAIPGARAAARAAAAARTRTRNRIAAASVFRVPAQTLEVTLISVADTVPSRGPRARLTSRQPAADARIRTDAGFRGSDGARLFSGWARGTVRSDRTSRRVASPASWSSTGRSQLLRSDVIPIDAENGGASAGGNEDEGVPEPEAHRGQNTAKESPALHERALIRGLWRQFRGCGRIDIVWLSGPPVLSGSSRSAPFLSDPSVGPSLSACPIPCHRRRRAEPSAAAAPGRSPKESSDSGRNLRIETTRSVLRPEATHCSSAGASRITRCMVTPHRAIAAGISKPISR